MTISVEAAAPGSPEVIDARREIGAVEGDFGAVVALSALNDERPHVHVLIAYRDGRPVGAMSFADTADGTKRINTGVVERRTGIGTALVRHLARLRPGTPMWCRSVPGAWPFCDALGMTHAGDASEGRRHYVWAAEDVDAFAKG